MHERSLTVLFVGNFRAPWCTEVHTSQSLERMGYRIVRCQEDELDFRSLPALAEEHHASALIWTRTWPVDNTAASQALETLRLMGVPSAFHHLDLWWPLERRVQVATEPYFQAVDVVFSPDGGNEELWREVGVDHRWMPPGVYAPECEPVAADLDRFPHEVVFVGSHPYPHAEWRPKRSAVIDACRQAFGDRFAVWPQGEPIRNRDLQALYATAKVAVGDSCLAGDPPPRRYWSDRTPETLGRGCAFVHPDVYEGYYRAGVDFDPYAAGDGEAAVAAVAALLDDDERRGVIAKIGRETVLGRDTYEHRMAEVLRVLVEDFGARPPHEEPRATLEGLRGLIHLDGTLRLELGSGRSPRSGYLHLDLNPAAPEIDLQADAADLGAFPDGSVVELRAVDVLEHLSYRDAPAALAEWARVLRPDGQLYVQVPDAELIMLRFVHDPAALLERIPNDLPVSPLMGAQWRLLGGHRDGGIIGPGDDWRWNAHFSMWSTESLMAALDTAGFHVERIGSNDHPNICCHARRS